MLFRGAVPRLALLLLLAAVAAACDDGLVDPNIDSLAIRPVLLRMIEGQISQLDVEALDAGGRFQSQADVAFGSLDSTVATVDEYGTVTANSPGWTKVWAAFDGMSDTTIVAVTLEFDRLMGGCGEAQGQMYCFSGSTPVPAPDMSWSSFADAGRFSCGISDEGRLFCQGDNFYRQLGADLGDDCDNGAAECTAEPLPDLRFSAVSAGGLHACAITTDDQLYCWGWDQWGAVTAGGEPCQTNYGFDYYQCATPPVPLGEYTDVAAGFDHTCAIRSDGTAFCWGANHAGALGTGLVDDSIHAATAVAPAIAWDTLVASADATCGLSRDGTRYCWGSEYATSIGLGSLPESCRVLPSLIRPCTPTPTSLPGEPRFTQISLGRVGCALDAEGTAYCWGERGGAIGAAGDPVPTPMPVEVGIPLVQVNAGTCALDIDGGVHCWGASGAPPSQLVNPPADAPALEEVAS